MAVSRLLLALTCATPADDDLAAADWDELDRLAAQHRLQPWLAERWPSGSGLNAPPAILERWSESRRAAAVKALAQRADLLAITALLADAGIRSVALKGAWLAWYAYPKPALRPMGDIDLLVPPDQVLAAAGVLRRAGYVQTGIAQHDPAYAVLHDKHLPELTSPGGTDVELHMRCWTGGAPRPRDAGILARARRMGPADPVLYPAAEDMLAHLVIHATETGRMDTGPLALVDLDMLLARERFDWPELVAQARDEGWLRHGALVIALMARWRRPGLVEESGWPLHPPEAVIATAEDLLAQDMTTRREAQVWADLSRAAAAGRSLRGLGRKLLGRSALAAGPSPRDFSGEGGYVPWLADRARRSLAGLLAPRVRRQAAGYRTVSAWCGGADAAA